MVMVGAVYYLKNDDPMPHPPVPSEAEMEMVEKPMPHPPVPPHEVSETDLEAALDLEFIPELDDEDIHMGTTSAQRNEFLYLHNVKRCMHGVPLLVWNDALARNTATEFDHQTRMKHS